MLTGPGPTMSPAPPPSASSTPSATPSLQRVAPSPVPEAEPLGPVKPKGELVVQATKPMTKRSTASGPRDQTLRAAARPRRRWFRYLEELEEAMDESTRRFTEQRMLGYPANTKDSKKLLEVRLIIGRHFTLLNNCLDPYNHDNSNWKNHSLGQERRLVTGFAKRYLPPADGPAEEEVTVGLGRERLAQEADPNLDSSMESSADVWGYVTGGGSESNLLGIKTACDRFQVLPGSSATLVLYTKDAHYSVPKIIRTQMRLPCAAVPTLFDGTIDYDELRVIARAAQYMGYKNFICVLTLGTTFTGALDDPARVRDILVAESPQRPKIYVHLDAALNGGFYDTCVRKWAAPRYSLGVDMDSISVSMHKWYGGAVASIFIVKEEPCAHSNPAFVPYLGVADKSISCSRDGFNAPLWLARLAQFDWDAEYAEVVGNVAYALERLRGLGVPTWAHDHSIIVVFPEPSKDTCERFQLATSHGLAHMVVVPSATRNLLDEFFAHLEAHGDVAVMKQRELAYDNSGWGRVVGAAEES